MSDAVAGVGAFLRRNPRERLLALLLAVVVWYAIREATSFEATIEDVPIEVLRDDGLAVLDQSDMGTDVRFSGSRTDIRDLARNQVRVVVDVRGKAREGPHTVAIGPGNVAAPRGARPVFVRVDRVSFSLDRETEKVVPVKVDLQGAPPPGVEVDRAVCSPAVVALRGPTSRLRGVESVRTLPIDLEGRQQTFRVRLALVPPGAPGETRLEPDRVQVEIEMAERAVSRTVEGVEVAVLTGVGAPRVAAIAPARVSVTVQGRAEMLAELRPEDIRAFVDGGRGTASGAYEMRVHVFVASALRIVAVEPGSVAVTFQEGERP